MRARRIDHIGIIVNDLQAAKAFFLELGLEPAWEGKAEGEWVERIIGLQGVTNEMAMMRTPDGGTDIELVRFNSPVDEAGPQRAQSNTLGIRHIAFEVDDVEAVADRLVKKGAELVGEIVRFEDSYRLCYIRGPEGIILELAEPLQ